MNDFRRLADLEEQLGSDRLDWILDPANRELLMRFCNKNMLPTSPLNMTIGKHTYQVLNVLKSGENSVEHPELMNRLDKIDKNSLGEGAGKYLLINKEDIPASLRGKVIFLFPYWNTTDKKNGYSCYCVIWNGFWWDKMLLPLLNGRYKYDHFFRIICQVD